MASEAILIIQAGLRIVGVVVCSNKAKEINRSSVGWGFFGFFFPIIAMIWVHSIKPLIKWDENIDIEKKVEN